LSLLCHCFVTILSPLKAPSVKGYRLKGDKVTKQTQPFLKINN
jgi:hypothetical protein